MSYAMSSDVTNRAIEVMNSLMSIVSSPKYEHSPNISQNSILRVIEKLNKSSYKNTDQWVSDVNFIFRSGIDDLLAISPMSAAEAHFNRLVRTVVFNSTESQVRDPEPSAPGSSPPTPSSTPPLVRRARLFRKLPKPESVHTSLMPIVSISSNPTRLPQHQNDNEDPEFKENGQIRKPARIARKVVKVRSDESKDVNLSAELSSLLNFPDQPTVKPPAPKEIEEETVPAEEEAKPIEKKSSRRTAKNGEAKKKRKQRRRKRKAKEESDSDDDFFIYSPIYYPREPKKRTKGTKIKESNEKMAISVDESLKDEPMASSTKNEALTLPAKEETENLPIMEETETLPSKEETEALPIKEKKKKEVVYIDGFDDLASSSESEDDGEYEEFIPGQKKKKKKKRCRKRAELGGRRMDEVFRLTVSILKKFQGMPVADRDIELFMKSLAFLTSADDAQAIMKLIYKFEPEFKTNENPPEIEVSDLGPETWKALIAYSIARHKLAGEDYQRE